MRVSSVYSYQPKNMADYVNAKKPTIRQQINQQQNINFKSDKGAVAGIITGIAVGALGALAIVATGGLAAAVAAVGTTGVAAAGAGVGAQVGGIVGGIASGKEDE